jgi:excisionase family DNA binding protein
MATFRPLLTPPVETPSAPMRAETARPRVRAPYPHRTWWTRERVVAALRRWHREYGTAPTSTEEWQRLTKGIGGRAPQDRPFPSFYGVLRYFRTFPEAWTAAGVDVGRFEQEWTPLEDWYLREGAGFLTRKELAADLQRTPEAVHRRLYDLGLHSYQLHGWTLNRIHEATGVPDYTLRAYLMRGLVPFRRGTKCFYVDPGDLVDVPEIDWSAAPAELERAARRSLIGRIVTLLEGGALLTRAEACAASLAAYAAERRPHRVGTPTSLRQRVIEAVHERDLLTVREAAPLLGVTTVTLYRWIAERGYPAERVALGGLSLVGVRRPARYGAGS